MEIKDKTKVSALECCPPLEACKICDTIDIKYRLPFRQQIDNDTVSVEVTLHFRFERCSGELTLGDLIHSTTLFPGEKVRMFTSDRNSRWSFDSETNLAYRHETTSEESFLMAGMASAMSDLTIVQGGSAVSSYSESATSGGGGAGIDLGIFEIGGSIQSSSFNAVSTSSFARNFSRHAESSSRHVEAGIRAASSTSVGEVERRSHAEGESESHFEASSRVFSNPNRCHALTFLFYKFAKCQTLCFDLIAIERRVVDPAAPTGAVRVPVNPAGKVTVRPQTVAATSSKRLELERNARVSAAESQQSSASISRPGFFDGQFLAARSSIPAAPISAKLHRDALSAVDRELASDKLISEKTGEVTKEAIARFSWKRTTTLPAAGILVKGCIDDCNICEPALQEEIKIGLERKMLRNELLKKRIELLENSQEYRCCPAGEVEEPATPDP